MSNARPKRIIVGMSGASGAIYGVRLLELLQHQEIETHLVMSSSAKLTLTLETDRTFSDLKALASVVHATNDIGASISSGSFHTMGMIICPCSMKSLAEVANGITTSLLTRAADVVLKERRRLVLVARETPLHLGHIRNMAAATEAGAIIYPPVPAMYAKPKSMNEMIDHTLGRVLDLFEIESKTVKRWIGTNN